MPAVLPDAAGRWRVPRRHIRGATTAQFKALLWRLIGITAVTVVVPLHTGDVCVVSALI